MAKSLGTLGDLFPDKPLACMVHGCPNMLDPSVAAEPGRPRGMCDRCYHAWRDMADKTMPCSTPGCDATWVWTRSQQIEAFAQGRKGTPPFRCEACRTRQNQLADKPMPCRVKGCKGTWVWSRAEQMKGERAPSRFCPDCFTKFNQLQDQEVPCRIKGCTKTWHWSRFQQLEYVASGRAVAEPPHRLCRSCLDKAESLKAVEVPCRVKGCKGTWSFSPYAQLEHLLTASAKEPVYPRMCPDCFRVYNSAQDKPLPCRHKGCAGTWPYTRMMQLQDHAAGRGQPAAQLCPDCTQAIRHTPPKPMPCTVPHCHGTWQYSPADQVRDRLAGKAEPTGRRCPACDRYLNEHGAIQVACATCGSEFKCSSYEQLLAHLGASTLPRTCTKCNNATAEQLQTEPRVERPNHLVIRIPHGGRWGSDPAIASLPPHIGQEKIRAAEIAPRRIVCLGDAQTWSAASAAESWPELLEAKLNADPAAPRAVVLNAGVPGTTSAQALVRLQRDVLPFAPQLVILSFIEGDCLLPQDRASGTADPEAFAALIRQLRQELPEAKLLFWTGTPMFPQDAAEANPELAHWANNQMAAYNQGLAHSRHAAEAAGLPVVDTARHFVIGGHKGARKWMKDWHSHNQAGAENLATWLAAAIAPNNLLPTP